MSGASGQGNRSKRLRNGIALVAALTLLLAAPLVAGCGGDESGSDGGAAASPTPSEITITDDAGNEITLQGPAERVVSLAPSTTEDMFAIGAGDKLVGVSDFCDYPEEAQTIEKVGGFADPNSEKIVSLDPDLVLATVGVQDEVVQQLKDLNVPVCVLDPTTFEGLYADLENLGLLVGAEESAKDLVAELKAQVEEVTSAVSGLEQPTVFFEIYSKPLMTAGSGTIIDEIVATAQGTSIGTDAGESYVEFSEEVLLKEDPDVYIAVKGSQDDPGDIAKRPGYDALKAVREGRVYVIDDNLVTRSGPRAVLGLAEVAVMLHPEAFETPQ